MRRARRRNHENATPAEWAWLTAAPNANPFIGLSPTLPAHLLELWAAHEDDIRAMWAEDPPLELPPFHPASEDDEHP